MVRSPGRDTICALTTGPPPSAVAMIRLSGPLVTHIAGCVLDRGLPEPRRLVLDTIRNENGNKIDTGLVAFMPGPASYTGEDTLELSLHGGSVLVERALDILFASGARLAQPGEFTKRAFEAGKLDLTQAEAVADLIEAESEAQHAQALAQMDGALSNLYQGWRQTLLDCLALLAAGIDFPDEDDAPDTVDQPVLARITTLRQDLQTALASGNIAERIRNGFRIAIVGKPNVGKSTLLNRLARREAAIVTDQPGTTRDIVEIRTVIGGYLVFICDTAGIRTAKDAVEAEGIKRALALAQQADIRIWVHDVRASFDMEDKIQPGDIILANKTDLVTTVPVSRETIHMSAITAQGLDRLEACLAERLAAMQVHAGSPLLTRARHRQGIERALIHLEEAENQLRAGYSIELAAENVRLASRALAALTGHVDSEQVLGAVFSAFCIGK